MYFYGLAILLRGCVIAAVASVAIAQGLNSCVYGTAPRFVLSTSKNFTFEQSGIRAEAFARWPSGRVFRQEYAGVEIGRSSYS